MRGVSLRSKLASVLDGVGVVRAALRLRKHVSAPWLTSFCYHRTAEPIPSDVDLEIIDASPAQFDQQIRFLAEHFRFVSVDEVSAYVAGKAKLPPNPVLITFDDGYKECIESSLPILQRYGAKATFFIPTQQMTQRRMFWWDRISWTLRHTHRTELHIEYPTKQSFAIGDSDGYGKAQEALTQIVKRTRGLDVDRFITELDRAADASLSRAEEGLLVDRVLMTWSEVKQLADAGMSIGSHSFSHRVLQTLEAHDYQPELQGSRREIEERLDIEVESIAYPVGYPLGDDENLRRVVSEAGYKLGFTCSAGVFGMGNVDPLDIPRILMDTAYDLQQFAAMTALPPLAPRSRTSYMRW